MTPNIAVLVMAALTGLPIVEEGKPSAS